MISGGNATVFVSNMDASVRFYTEVLGLKLTNRRFGNSWATVDAGKGLTIGLHPASPKGNSPRLVRKAASCSGSKSTSP